MTRMSTATAGDRPDSTWRALLVLLGALTPALIAVLPLTLAPGEAVGRLLPFTIAIAPFLATAVSLLSARAAGQDLAGSCRFAAWFAFGFGGAALMAGMGFALSY
jgi:hypothetical protein